MSSYHQVVSDIRNGVDRFFSKAFTSIEFDGPALNIDSISSSPHMVVCTHRSHVDYFLLGNELFTAGFKNMRFAAGDNLTNLPYIGPRFRQFGAFAVSRDTGFERNYVRNLCNQVVGMLEQGQPVIVFPEGGRSYNGAMLEVKSGIIGAAVLAQVRNPDLDVYYLPSTISYECPPDIPFFRMLLKGKKLRKRTNGFPKRLLGNAFYFGADLLAFVPFLLSRRMGRSYGAAYVDYHEPVSIRKTIDISANKAERARDEFSAHRASMQKMGEEIYRQFVSLYRILPMHIVAEILCKHKDIAESEIARRVPGIIDDLRKSGRNLKTIDKEGSPEMIAQRGIDQLAALKSVKKKNDTVFVKKSSIIEYCAASIHRA